MGLGGLSICETWFKEEEEEFNKLELLPRWIQSPGDASPNVRLRSEATTDLIGEPLAIRNPWQDFSEARWTAPLDTIYLNIYFSCEAGQVLLLIINTQVVFNCLIL